MHTWLFCGQIQWGFPPSSLEKTADLPFGDVTTFRIRKLCQGPARAKKAADLVHHPPLAGWVTVARAQPNWNLLEWKGPWNAGIEHVLWISTCNGHSRHFQTQHWHFPPSVGYPKTPLTLSEIQSYFLTQRSVNVKHSHNVPLTLCPVCRPPPGLFCFVCFLFFGFFTVTHFCYWNIFA